MDTNVVIGISVGVPVFCFGLACLIGERVAQKRRKEEARQFRAAANPVEGKVLMCDT